MLSEEKAESDHAEPENEQAQHRQISVNSFLEGTSGPKSDISQKADDKHWKKGNGGRFIVTIKCVAIGIGNEVACLSIVQIGDAQSSSRYNHHSPPSHQTLQAD